VTTERDGGVVAALQEVARGAQALLGRDAPQSWSDDEREDERAEARGPDPPPRADPVSVAFARRAERRAGADVGGDERREEQARPELAAGETILRHLPSSPALSSASRSWR
jgi:hypothetical protein